MDVWDQLEWLLVHYPQIERTLELSARATGIYERALAAMHPVSLIVTDHTTVRRLDVSR